MLCCNKVVQQLDFPLFTFLFSLSLDGSHKVDDADEEHDGCVFQYIDRFAHQTGNGDRERLGSDDAENATNRRKSENDGRFMLTPVDRKVSGAEYF